MPDQLPSAWERFCMDAWTDDWVDLCDTLGIDYRDLGDADTNSRQLRKVVRAWADEHDAWAKIKAAVGRWGG